MQQLQERRLQELLRVCLKHLNQEEHRCVSSHKGVGTEIAHYLCQDLCYLCSVRL
jgi:hypothetical protein